MLLEAFEDRLVLDGGMGPLRQGLPPTGLISPANPSVSGLAETRTTLTASARAVFVGEGVTFTATVSAVEPGGGIPAGTVTFLQYGAPIAQDELDENGQAFLATSFGEAGDYVITAVYEGSDEHSGSGSQPVTLTAVGALTITELAVEVEDAVFGQPVTLTAAVGVREPGSGLPTGTVTFRAGAVVLGRAELNEDGVAELSATTIPVGSVFLTASYDGDRNYQPSTSAGVAIQVSRAGADVFIDADPNPAGLGQEITLTVLVVPQEPSVETPTGTVVLRRGGQVVATGSLQGGLFTFRTSTLPLGRHTFTARYEGSAGFEGGTSLELEVLVGTLNQRWVARMYRDLILRDVDPAGLAVFTGMLDRGDDFAVVAQRMMFECGGMPVRCEFWEQTVRGLYRTLLRREPDLGGLGAYVQFLRGGGTISQVRASLLGSAEYFNNAQFGGGGTNPGFVNAIFRDLMGRAPTTQERIFWTQVLDQGATREDMARSLLRTAEPLGRIATQYVQRLLQRDPSAEEVDYLVEFFLAGSREEEVIAVLVSSAEYVFSV